MLVSHVYRGSTKSIFQMQLSIESRQQKLTDRMEISCVKDYKRGGMFTAREAIKQLQEEFEVEVSEEPIH